MSYCRWSSDSGTCDLYCYEDVEGGWVTHVATVRLERRPRRTDPLSEEGFAVLDRNPDEWSEMRRRFNEEVDSIPRVTIGGPHDGKSFRDRTLEGFRDRLVSLREDGYRFPASVLTVEAEMEETDDDE